MLRDVSCLVNKDFHHYKWIKFPADKNKFLEFSTRRHRLDRRSTWPVDSSRERYFVDGNITNTAGRIGPLANWPRCFMSSDTSLFQPTAASKCWCITLSNVSRNFIYYRPVWRQPPPPGWQRPNIIASGIYTAIILQPRPDFWLVQSVK